MTGITDEKGKITLGLIISWLLGGMFLVFGATLMFHEDYGAGFSLPCLFIAAVLLPPIRKFAYKKTGKSLSTGVRAVLVIVAFGVAAAALPPTNLSAPATPQVTASAMPEHVQASEQAYAQPAAQPVQPKETSGLSEQLKANIMERCQMDNGEFGATLVKACVDQDIKAYKGLQAYPAEHAALIERCKMDNGEYGWMLVKACVDQDIKSQKALSDY